MDTPLFTHDCTNCKFLGRYEFQAGDPEMEPYDLYLCSQNQSIPTVIARYGNDGPSYLSGLEAARAIQAKNPGHPHPLVVALQRAVEQKLLPDTLKCPQCGVNDVAYLGARFCGAGCTAEFEMHVKAVLNP